MPIGVASVGMTVCGHVRSRHVVRTGTDCLTAMLRAVSKSCMPVGGLLEEQAKKKTQLYSVSSCD